MIEYIIHEINPAKDLPTLEERVSRLPEWRRRNTLSYINPIDRLQSAIAYELLARLLKKCCNVQPYGFRIEYDSYGKPSIHGYNNLNISLSHCCKGVMAIVSDQPVGCDIEEIKRPYSRNSAEIAEYCFNEAERNRIMSAPDSAVEFTKIWTIKEALFKLDNSLDIENTDTEHVPIAHVSSVVSAEYVATFVTCRLGL